LESLCSGRSKMYRVLARCSLELMVSEGEGNGESGRWSQPVFLWECAAIGSQTSKNTNSIRQMSQSSIPQLSLREGFFAGCLFTRDMSSLTLLHSPSPTAPWSSCVGTSSLESLLSYGTVIQLLDSGWAPSEMMNRNFHREHSRGTILQSLLNLQPR
jgi:hypothetical protein